MDNDLYEINKWLDEHYCFRNYESKLREFFTNKYGKEEARKRLVEIKELAHFLDEHM